LEGFLGSGQEEARRWVEQKEEKFGYPEGFKKGGLARYHLPSFRYPSRNYTPPDTLFAPEHNFQHALRVNNYLPIEVVYGRGYGKGGICVSREP
jgi:hypothetical protein